MPNVTFYRNAGDLLGPAAFAVSIESIFGPGALGIVIRMARRRR